MESGYDYPERSDDNQAEVCENAKAERDVRIKDNIIVSSEVSRSYSKPATSCNLSA
jgi:hypothetical protein